jgi:hypothetical protein
MATLDGDDLDGDVTPAHKPLMLQILESTIIAVHKPVKVLLSLAAGIFSLRFVAAFLQIVLEVHAEHEHIAPGWLGNFQNPIFSVTVHRALLLLAKHVLSFHVHLLSILC